MPPIANLTAANQTSSPCTIALVEQLISQQNNACNCNSTAKSLSIGKSELEALLYIVVTLLFYSLGIIVGIITYLKKERKEIEEDKVFDAFITEYIEPETRSRFDKVQQVIARLQYLKEQKESKAKMGSEERNIKSIAHVSDHNKNENCNNSDCVEFVKTGIIANDMGTLQTESGAMGGDEERLSSIVAKLIDPEKRQSRESIILDDDDDGDDPVEGGITKTLSMQSIKDYTEEPGRSGRSSLACDDDDDDDNVNNENDESSALLTEGSETENVEKDIDHATSPHKPINRGCIVTNV